MKGHGRMRFDSDPCLKGNQDARTILTAPRIEIARFPGTGSSMSLVKISSGVTLVISGEAHLRRILKTYAAFYNEIRSHLALEKETPNCRRSQTVGAIVAIPVLGGLHHQYLRV